MLKGYFQSNGVRVSQRRISEAAKEVAPRYHRARLNDTARLRNPVPSHIRLYTLATSYIVTKMKNWLTTELHTCAL